MYEYFALFVSEEARVHQLLLYYCFTTALLLLYYCFTLYLVEEHFFVR